ncbi:MAG: rRNA maturation RNase YbeY [Mariniblastus sp.]
MKITLGNNSISHRQLNQPHKIEIANEQSQPIDSDPLISAVKLILNDHSIEKSEISIGIVDDPAMRAYNKQYLNHDYETDVLSFVLDWDETIGALSGQLIVSTDTAETMASQYGSTMQEELLLYVIHGTLHLVGYDDKDPADETEMRDAEKQYLANFGVEHRWGASEQEQNAIDDKAAGSESNSKGNKRSDDGEVPL